MPMMSDKFPYTFEKVDKGRTTFAPKELTIDRVFDKYGVGYTFEEDPNEPSSIWNMQGEWDDSIGARGGRKPYAGPMYDNGTKVEATLQHREYKKRDGTDGEARDILSLKVLAVQAMPDTDDPETPAQPLATSEVDKGLAVAPKSKQDIKWEKKDQEIRKAQALNLLVELSKSKAITDRLFGKKFPLDQVILHEIDQLANADECDFSYWNDLTALHVTLPSLEESLIAEDIAEEPVKIDLSEGFVEVPLHEPQAEEEDALQKTLKITEVEE